MLRHDAARRGAAHGIPYKGTGRRQEPWRAQGKRAKHATTHAHDRGSHRSTRIPGYVDGSRERWTVPRLRACFRVRVLSISLAHPRHSLIVFHAGYTFIHSPRQDRLLLLLLTSPFSTSYFFLVNFVSLLSRRRTCLLLTKKSTKSLVDTASPSAGNRSIIISSVRELSRATTIHVA